LLVFSLFIGCITGPKIETLFVGDGIMQYFVYPTTLKNDSSKISIDIIYRRFKDKEGFVTVNFSFFYNDLIFSELKTAGFISDEKNYQCSEVKILFQEKRNHLVRYTSKMKESDFVEMIKKGHPVFYLETDISKSTYPATNEFENKLNELSIEIF
jgi:curved DNA-binding protein CbpA